MRGNTRMSWKYDDNIVCVCMESEEHVLLDCNLYMDVTIGWKEKLASVNVEVKNDHIERETLWYLGTG